MSSTTIRRHVLKELINHPIDGLSTLFNIRYENYMNNKIEIAKCEGDSTNKASSTCRLSLLTKTQLEHDNITNEVDLKYMAKKIMMNGGVITPEQKNNINLPQYSGGKKKTHRHNNNKSKRQKNHKRGRRSRSRVV